MWNRVGVLALTTSLLAVLLSGCPECSDADDCRRSRGPAPAGQQWVCNAGMCETSGGQQPGTDGGTDGGTDAGTDGGTDGGTSSASQQISTVRSTAAGTNLTLPIEGAFVTYKRPGVGSDLAGFFLQADPEGPALFVSDATATGQVSVGDRVNLTVTGKAVTSGVQIASTVTGLTIVNRGNPVQNLATDAQPGLLVDRSSATDLVTNINNYESELVRLSGEISGASRAAGGGHTAFPLKTAGIPTAPATGAFELRVPTPVGDELDLGQGCTVTLRAGPLWRFTGSGTPPTTNVQPSAYATSDLTADCPAPTLSSAAPLSSNRVLLTFDRRIAESSITAPATQFTFTNGVTASAASVNGRQITLTTSNLTAGTSYTVTVAESVRGTSGKPVAAPNNTATFTGIVQLAVRGARLQVAGSGFTGATAVTLGGVSQTFTVDSDTSITIAPVADTTPVGSQPIVVTTPGGNVEAGSITVISLVINELDADTPGTDVAEFIEIATGVPNLDITGAGLSIVFFNGGANDTSYFSADLAGTTNAAGLLLVGNPGVTPAPQVTIPNGTLENGADAVGLYQAPASAFATGTAATANNLIDAIVYDTADADDTGLLGALLVANGQVQVDEASSGSSANNSIQRCGPARRDGNAFRVAAPTPGAANTCP